MVRQGKPRKRTKRRSNRAGMMGGPPPPYQKPTGAPPPYEHPPSYDQSERDFILPPIDEERIRKIESDIRAIKQDISEIRKACLSHKSSKKRTKKSK